MSDSSDLVAPFFEPLSLRGMTIANRIAMAPMSRYFCPGRSPGPDVVEYYRRRAAGGVGLIITEAVGIDRTRSIDDPRLPVLDDADGVAAWRRVTDAVHREGGKILMQLWHMGVLWDAQRAGRMDLASLRPSGVLGPIGFTSLAEDRIRLLQTPTGPMTEEEIADIVAGFSRTAGLAIAAGFDGIEIHGAHGYLVDAFLWPGTNQRTDRWGGDVRARARFGAEVVRAIRAAIG
ncbi:MAG TPA: 12-oxophytodienoate reductase, partial [Novosphingobium sp.]